MVGVCGGGGGCAAILEEGVTLVTILLSQFTSLPSQFTLETSRATCRGHETPLLSWTLMVRGEVGAEGGVHIAPPCLLLLLLSFCAEGFLTVVQR